MRHDPRPPVAWQRLVPRLLLLFGLLTLGLGFWGLSGHYGLAPRSVVRALFDVSGMLVLEKPPPDAPNNWQLALARFTALITAGLGVLFIVLGVYREAAEQLRLRAFGRRARAGGSPLVVVCGLGRIGRQLVADLTSESGRTGKSVVAIEIDADNPWIQTARERGAVVLAGDARDRSVRLRARLDRASEVFIVCGNDSTNLDVAAEIVRDVEEGRAGRQRTLKCYASVLSSTLASAARVNPAFTAPHGRMRFEMFNVIESAARLLVKEELGRRHAPRRDEVAHYVVFGFGAMGQAVALQAARLAHYENDLRLRMTIIDDWDDPDARKARLGFLDRHPAFCPDPDTFDLLAHVRDPSTDKDAWHHRAGRPANPAWRFDTPVNEHGHATPIEYVVNAEFLSMETDVDSQRLVDQLAARLVPGQSPPVRPCLIVCFDDDRRNLEAALRISDALAREGLEPPIYVYLPLEPGLSTFLRRGREEGTLGEVRAFGACEVSASYRRVVQPEIIERADSFRKGYRKARRADGETDKAASALDFAFWASNQEAAHHVDLKLAAVERIRRGRDGQASPEAGMFSAGELDALARMEHNRWVAERLVEGWRYGPRDNRRKRRESLIPWRDLPEEERVKDFEQIEELAAWMAGIDLDTG